MKDWIDVYNRFPKAISTIAIIAASVIFSGLFISSLWFLYALVTR